MDQETTRPLAETIWWLIPGKVAGMRKPTPEELPELQALGIGAIVSVMDDPANLEAYTQAGIPYKWLPTTGGTAPTLEQCRDLQAFISEQNQHDHAVAVHCTSGRRRTGTILAAYLILQGAPYVAAVQAIQRANPEVELREAQTVFLHALAQE